MKLTVIFSVLLCSSHHPQARSTLWNLQLGSIHTWQCELAKRVFLPLKEHHLTAQDMLAPGVCNANRWIQWSVPTAACLA